MFNSWNRDSCFFVGVLLLLIGAEFRYVERITLSQPVTEVIAHYTQPEQGAAQRSFNGIFQSVGQAGGRRVVEPPKWLGLAVVSAGVVFALQSFVMPKP